MIAATQSNHPLASVSEKAVADSPLNEARSRIRNAQMRITKPRIAIIESLLQHEGPVSRSYLHNGTCLYEVTVGNPRHYHIVCKSCGQTERVDYFSVEGMERMLQDRGYTQLSHVVEFVGICPSCQKVAPARNAAPAMPAESL
jgi:Fe2+ or Zn2+ uptake regulation protein